MASTNCRGRGHGDALKLPELLPNQQQVNQPRPVAITGLASKQAARNASNPARPIQHPLGKVIVCGF